MARNVSRRKIFTGALTAGLAASAAPKSAFAQAAAQKTQRPELPDVWGADSICQWSPPANVKRDLTPGPQPIRLSNIHMVSKEGTDYAALCKSMVDGGWSACEAASAEFLSRKIPDSEAMEIKKQLKAHDVIFYGIHCAGNIIAPDPDADKWQRHIVDAIHTAAQFDCTLVLTHSGSLYPNRNTPHPQNWSKEGWTRAVTALKRILKDTSGIKIELPLESVESEAVNSPWSHKRMIDDVGDDRMMAGPDITNQIFPHNVFRTTELINANFDVIGEKISYVHAKDVVWNAMLPGLNWAMNCTGSMDYEVFLTHLSRMKRPRNMLVEFLSSEEEYQQAQRNIRAVAKKVGVTIYGKQSASLTQAG
jgi:sugar phosphate isomerase/epimerase